MHSTPDTMHCIQDIIGRIFQKPIYSVLEMMKFTVEYRKLWFNTKGDCLREERPLPIDAELWEISFPKFSWKSMHSGCLYQKIILFLKSSYVFKKSFMSCHTPNWRKYFHQIRRPFEFHFIGIFVNLAAGRAALEEILPPVCRMTRQTLLHYINHGKF